MLPEDWRVTLTLPGTATSCCRTLLLVSRMAAGALVYPA